MLFKPWKNQRLVEKTIIALFMAVYVFGNVLNIDSGVPDNGDWSRIMTWYTSKPANFDINFPDPSSPLYDQRFFLKWVPFWDLDYPGYSMIFSSVIFLWFPGILLNRVVFSSEILFLPLMSIPIRGLGLFLFWLVLRFIYLKSRPLLYLTLALPILLMNVSSDYLGYYNTFYQETAMFLFLPITLLAIYAVHCKEGVKSYFFYALSIWLLATSKAAYFYWPWIALPFIIPRFSEVLHKPLKILLMLIFLAIIPSVSPLLLSDTPFKYINSYHRLYYGVLTFSQDPEKHLVGTVFEHTEFCVGKNYFASAPECTLPVFQSQEAATGLLLNVIVNEPGVLLGILDYGSQNLQTLMSARYMDGTDAPTSSWLNIWSEFKVKFFPKGGLLYGFLLVFLIVFGSGIAYAQLDWVKALSKIGFVVVLAIPADILVAVLGDGKQEIEKHLFTANICFDLALILVKTAFFPQGSLQREALARLGRFSGRHTLKGN
jgi:hypothetical protein